MQSLNATIQTGACKIGDHTYAIAYATIPKSSNPKNDDAFSLRDGDDRISILVADGATGAGFGDIASSALKSYFDSAFDPKLTARQIKSFLIDADSVVRAACSGAADGADTTGIVLTIGDGKIEGASAGDSQAFIYGASTHELTANQRRRPRIGNGGYAQDFTSLIAPGDVLVIATDGLWNRISSEEVGRICLDTAGADQTVAKLLNRSRTSDGKLDDDVTIVCIVCS